MSVLFPLLVAFALSLGWVLLQVFTARVASAPFTRVGLGFGPVLASPRLGGVEVHLRLIPLGADVVFEPATLGSPLMIPVSLVPWLLIGLLAVGAGAGADDFVAGVTGPLRAREILEHWTGWFPRFEADPLRTCARLGARLVGVNAVLPGCFGWALAQRLLPSAWRERALAIGLVVLVFAVLSSWWR